MHQNSFQILKCCWFRTYLGSFYWFSLNMHQVLSFYWVCSNIPAEDFLVVFPLLFLFFSLSAHVYTKHTAGLNLHFSTCHSLSIFPLFAHLSSLNSFVSVKNICSYLWNKSLRLCSNLMFYFRTFMWFPHIFHLEPNQVLLSYLSAGDSFYFAIQESVCKTLSI